MNVRRPFLRIAVALLMVSFAAVACNSSSSDGKENDEASETKDDVGTLNVAGVHTGSRKNSDGLATIRFNFNQAGSMLTGSYSDSGFGSGTISGNIEGNDLQFSTVLASGNVIIEWIGQAESNGSTISGTWSMAVGGTGHGTWSTAR